jgi:UDP-glucose 4-epimerase
MRMRVVVTGGAGYIGSVLTEELVRDGHAVLVIDNLSKGHRDAVVDGAQFLQADLSNRHAVVAAMRSFGAEATIHMAADSLVGESMVDPAKYYQNNVVTGLTLLDAMRDAGVWRFVMSSTAAVYGEPAEQPITESASTRPTNTYGDTKLALEGAAKWYAGAYGFSAVSLRYFNAAGASEQNGERHSPETHLIPLVLEAAAGLRPDVTIFGDDYPTRDGTCVRDYIHVRDLARAHILALTALDVPGTTDVYNLGCGGAGYSVREVIDAASRVTGRRVPSRLAPRRLGDPAALVASSDRIHARLRWTPRFQELDTIIQSAWTWMQRGATV